MSSHSCPQPPAAPQHAHYPQPPQQHHSLAPDQARPFQPNVALHEQNGVALLNAMMEAATGVPAVHDQPPPQLTAAQLVARDDIARQIAAQAAAVRQSFERSAARTPAGGATAAAASHMARLHRKRTFEAGLGAYQLGVAPEVLQSQRRAANFRQFRSPVAGYTRDTSGGSRTSQPGAMPTLPTTLSVTHQPPRPKKEARPRTSDGIVLRAHPEDLTVTYNDVVCGKGKTTSSLVGNQRYKVWIDLHKESFAKAFSDGERRGIAVKIVDSVTGGVPPGRFLSLDIHTGLWYNVGKDRAVGITLEALMAETGRMKPVQPARKASVRRTFTSKAA
ncbi:hypothetical protein ACHAXT_008887 [Thalassiosira profunda]